MSKLIKDFFGAPAGEIYPRTIPAGEECPANLETAARQAGALPPDEVEQPTPSQSGQDPSAETKAPGAAADTSSGSANTETAQTSKKADNASAKNATGQTGK